MELKDLKAGDEVTLYWCGYKSLPKIKKVLPSGGIRLENDMLFRPNKKYASSYAQIVVPTEADRQEFRDKEDIKNCHEAFSQRYEDYDITGDEARSILKILHARG